MNEIQNKKSSMHPMLWTTIVLMIISAVVFVMAYRMIAVLKKQTGTERMPELHRIARDLKATERSGKQVALSSLHGKVWVVAYVFTRCPRACSEITSEMLEVYTKFRKNENFHLVSVTVDPEHDDAAQLMSFAKRLGADKNNWWFLTGEKENIRAYMNKELLFRPVSKSQKAEDFANTGIFVHDTRLGLIDHRGVVRGFYDVISPSSGKFMQKKIKQDIEALLKEVPES